MHFFASIEKAKRDVPDWMPKFSMLEGLRNLEFAEVIQLMFSEFPRFLGANQTWESGMMFFFGPFLTLKRPQGVAINKTIWHVDLTSSSLIFALMS